MQWLLHGLLDPEIATALLERQDAIHLAVEAELNESSTMEDVLTAAHKKQWDVLTADAALARAASAGQTRFNRSIVHLPAENQARAIARLFERYSRLTPGRLYTVTGSRVKIRQLPTRRPRPAASEKP